MELKKKMQKARGSSKKSLQRRAIQLLKQKKMYEKQLDQTMSQQFNLDQVKFMQQNLKDTADTVAAMKTANTALKA